MKTRKAKRESANSYLISNRRAPLPPPPLTPTPPAPRTRMSPGIPHSEFSKALPLFYEQPGMLSPTLSDRQEAHGSVTEHMSNTMSPEPKVPGLNVAPSTRVTRGFHVNGSNAPTTSISNYTAYPVHSPKNAAKSPLQMDDDARPYPTRAQSLENSLLRSPQAASQHQPHPTSITSEPFQNTRNIPDIPTELKMNASFPSPIEHTALNKKHSVDGDHTPITTFQTYGVDILSGYLSNITKPDSTEKDARRLISDAIQLMESQIFVMELKLEQSQKDIQTNNVQGMLKLHLTSEMMMLKRRLERRRQTHVGLHEWSHDYEYDLDKML